MDGDPIPPTDTALRHCNKLQVDQSGRVSGAAFMYKERDLRSDEPYLSICWLEYDKSISREEQLQMVRRELACNLTVRPSHKLAPLNVGFIKDYILREIQCSLNFLHKPLRNYSTHSGIFGVPIESPDLVAAMLAEKAGNPVPAIAPES